MLNALLPLRNELIGFGASVGLVLAYHYYLRLRVRRDPNYTIQSINALARRAWVEGIMSKGQPDVLPVQTLRNSTMAATFLASTAILLIIGVLNLSAQGDKLSHLLQLGVPASGAASHGLWNVKLAFLVVDLFWAFFAFTSAVRLYNHVGFLINTPPEGGRRREASAYVALLLNRAGGHYSAGMRCFYLSVPLVFWLFGPVYMAAATVALVAILYHIDRAPRDAGLERTRATPLRPVPMAPPSHPHPGSDAA